MQQHPPVPSSTLKRAWRQLEQPPAPQHINPPEVVTGRQLAPRLLDTVTRRQSIVWPPERERDGDKGRQRTAEREREIIKYDLGLSERHIRAVLKSQTTSCSLHNSTTDAHSAD